LVDAANEFIAETEPWALSRHADTQDRLTQVLYEAAEAVRIAAVLLLPVMPASSAEMLRRMGEDQPASTLRLDRAAGWQAGRGRTIAAADPLWPRIVETTPAVVPVTAPPGVTTPAPTAEAGKELMMTTEPSGTPPAPETTGAQQPDAPTPAPAATASAPPSAEPRPEAGQPAPPDDRISIEDFMKVELRVARIVEAERVKGSRKLVKMQIDLGAEQRTVVAGIAEAYAPEALVGRTVVMVANLKPAKLMGVESNGMVLAASPDGGLPVLVGFEQPPAPGTRVR
jgi:methionyl-tRNA synthetase